MKRVSSMVSPRAVAEASSIDSPDRREVRRLAVKILVSEFPLSFPTFLPAYPTFSAAARPVRIRSFDAVRPPIHITRRSSGSTKRTDVFILFPQLSNSMFVKFMFADEWHDRTDRGTAMANPTWDQVKQAIAALDGKQRTMLTVADKEGDDHYLIVAGQWDGRCLVNATKDNYDFFSLVDPSRSIEKRMLYVGGQNGEYEERKCVPLEWALEAAEHFFETGELKSSMNWVSDY